MTRKNRKNKSYGRGWHGDKRRHQLAGMGVKTVIDDKWRFRVDDFVARGRQGELTTEDIEELKPRIEALEGVDIDDVRIKKNYGVVQVYLTTEDDKKFVLVGDWDRTNHLAVRKVMEQLKHEPYLFNKNFLKQHGYVSDTDIRLILDDETEMAYDRFQERGFEGEELNDKINEYIREKKREIKRNPWGYFEDMGYDTDQILDQFIRFDREEVAEEAVRSDGEGHFLSLYDGMIREIPGREAVYWRID